MFLSSLFLPRTRKQARMIII